MKNKRRNGAQPEMKSPFKGHGEFPHQAERRGGQPLLCSGMPFMASQKHCLLKLDCNSIFSWSCSIIYSRCYCFSSISAKLSLISTPFTGKYSVLDYSAVKMPT